MQRITAQEGEPLELDAVTANQVRAALDRLTHQLKPRLPLADEQGGRIVLRNLIGTVALSPRKYLEVNPKVGQHLNWVGATLDLMDKSRIDVTGSRSSSRSRPRPELLEAIASIYADRLTEAIKREGPLLTLHQQFLRSKRLNGRLAVSTWVRSGLLRPHQFPISNDTLDANNDYTAAMALVARRLARVSKSPTTSDRLTAAARALRPGLPESDVVDPFVIQRQLPPQWLQYLPAWSIAVSVLSRGSLLQRAGSLHGVEVAIEPWPLLETLLRRALYSACGQAVLSGVPLSVGPIGGTPLISPDLLYAVHPSTPLARILKPREAVPDGRITYNGSTVATFEAKYSRPPDSKALRSHVFQALSTAAAYDCPLSILVYPEESESVCWTVHGFSGKPSKVVAIGLGMYSYVRGPGDLQRGARLRDVLTQAGIP